MSKKLFETPYGYFSPDGREYVITQPRTPRPWVNVICPGDYGLVVSQAGTGYSWRTHASLNRLTRWNQDLINDQSGKFIYLRDDDTGQFWSATWQPLGGTPEFFECRHGMGYSIFVTRQAGIETALTIFVPPAEPLEIWSLQVRNLGARPRRLSLWTYLEWCLGEAPDSHREFHRIFIETALASDRRTILARKRLWAIPNARGQHWNRSWDFVAWHSVNRPLRDWSGSKEAFLGAYGRLEAPAALAAGDCCGPTTGKWDDGIASLGTNLKLGAHRSRNVVWTLGAARSGREARALAGKYHRPGAAAQAWAATGAFWNRHLAAAAVATPDVGFDLLANHWLKYQALSARIWGRTGYYQAGGAFGYRDQLQDSQIFLSLDPARTRRQILLHAAHQYPEGFVHHWWHPITEEGLKSRYADDFLWLPFVLVNYLKETGDFAVLQETAPFLTEGKAAAESATLYEHCRRAIALALRRRSPRGLPLIGTGDWNDGLSAAGWDGKGESVWVAQFLCGILHEFSELIPRAIAQRILPPAARQQVRRYRAEAGQLARAVNRHGWDGQWYWAASCDDGTLIGRRRGREGRIHLNPQTWAVLTGLAPANRQRLLLRSIERHLYGKYGALVLAPAYQRPDKRIGYLTRYAPGVRENGGTYTHAAVWAIQMECLLKRNERAWELFQQISPPARGMKPEVYAAEPYVTPGNVDGPDSPYYGRGGWTWYTGSAAWLYRIMTEWIIGVRPEWAGLKIDPCVPRSWQSFQMTRRYRGTTYHLAFVRDPKLAKNTTVIWRNGRPLLSNILPPVNSGGEIELGVRFN